MKKTVTLLLSLVLLFSFVPSMIFAADTVFDDVGINLGPGVYTGSKTYQFTTSTAGTHLVSINTGGNNMLAGTQITLTIDGTPIVIPVADISVFGLADVSREVNLDPGQHTVVIDAVLVPGAGGLESLVISSISIIEYMTVANPSFAPVTGTYVRTTKAGFDLPVVWRGASIRFTTDGTDPSATNGALYVGLFDIFPAGTAVGAQITYKAIAYQSGKASSAVVTAVYTAAADSATLADVTCNRNAGALTNSTMTGITLTHASTSTGGTIWYTVDGSDPAPNNPNAKKYVSGIKILRACTLRARAFDTNGNSSAILERAYTVTSSTVTYLHLPAGTTTVGKGSAIQLTTATNVSPYTKIYYTISPETGDNPVYGVESATNHLFTGPIPVPALAHNATFTVRAIAGGDGLSTTAVTSQNYTYDANTKRLTWIKDDPDFIAWKAGGFVNGEEPQSLIDLIDEIYDELPKTTAGNTNGSGIFAAFCGGGTTAAQGVPGSAWGASGIYARGIPDHFSYDGPAGARLTAESGAAYERDVTYWPNGSARAANWNKDLSYQQGVGWGKELQYFALNIILAPGINVHRSVLNGRNFEYYSEDPLLVGLTSGAEIRGIQADGKAGVSLKHFAVNNQENNRTNAITRASTRTLREIYLRAFEYAVKDSNPWSLMNSFNDINGIHATHNYDLNTTILRNEWGWNWHGLVMTDYNGYGTVGNGSATSPNNTYPYYPQGLAPNIHAGVFKSGDELLLATATASNIQTAYASGYITDNELRTAFRRLCIYVSKFNSFNCDAWHYYSDPVTKAENNAIAHQLAEEGAILLQNNNVAGSPALPLNKAASGKILSLGLAADDLYRGGTGSGSINMTAMAAAGLTQIPEALRNVVGYDKVINTANTVEFPRPTATSGAPIDGISLVTSRTATGAIFSTGAKNEISFSDERFSRFYNEDLSAVLFVLARESGENADVRVQKGAYYLSDAEERLINQGSALAKAKNIPFVIILNTGTWPEMESWKPKVDAIIQCWNTGQAAAVPMVKLLFGDVNPSGKLPTTVPIDVVGKDANGNFLNPSEGEFAKSNANWNNAFYREGIFVGYRYYDSFGVECSYPFGFGLSYTTFDFNNPTLSKATFDGVDDTLTATVTVTNTGTRAGKEVAQFYVGAPGIELIKPVKELKGYDKTKLLEPGQSDTISVKFNADLLASYDELRGMWVIEPGRYNVYFSNSSAKEDIKHTLTFTVADEIIVSVVDKTACAPLAWVTASGGRDSTTSAVFYEYSPYGLNLDVKVYRTRAQDGNVALNYMFTVINKSASGEVGDVGSLILAEYDANGRLLRFAPTSSAGYASPSNQPITATGSAATDRNFISYQALMTESSFLPETVKLKAFLWNADGTYVPMNGGSFIKLR